MCVLSKRQATFYTGVSWCRSLLEPVSFLSLSPFDPSSASQKPQNPLRWVEKKGARLPLCPSLCRKFLFQKKSKLFADSSIFPLFRGFCSRHCIVSTMADATTIVNPVPTPAGVTLANPQIGANASLYVGDLHPDVSAFFPSKKKYLHALCRQSVLTKL